MLDGKVTFEVDGEAVDAPPGTLVFVGPEARRKATGDGTVLVVGATPGEAYSGIDWGDAWPFHSESMTAYGEQRYADALEAVRGALEHLPDHAGLHYNYACFATLAGDTSDDTFAHLRRSVELRPRFREDARRDDDFAAVRDDPRFEQALAERAGPTRCRRSRMPDRVDTPTTEDRVMSIVVRYHPKNVTIAQYEEVLRREQTSAGTSFRRTAGSTTSASERTETCKSVKSGIPQSSSRRTAKS